VSLDNVAAQLAEQVKGREVKTLFLDIERLPGRARHQHRGLTIEGDFWDLNGWKHTLGYRLPPDSVLEYPSTFCFSALWYGDKKASFHTAWDIGFDELHRIAFDLYDQADIAITFNGVSFDNKHLRGGWVERGMGEPSPWRDIDLLKVARGSLGWESKTLDSVCKRLQIPAKNGKFSIAVARAAMAGARKAQREIKSYSVNDSLIMPAVYERLMPLVKGHPHVAPVRGEDANLCPRCGSDDVRRNGTYSPGVYHYKAYTCQTCSGHFRTTYESRGPSVRAL
jgi:hypothetical protein